MACFLPVLVLNIINRQKLDKAADRRTGPLLILETHSGEGKEMGRERLDFVLV